MNKISVIVSCPIDTYSGYGARSRDLVKALLKLEKYDVKILSQRWGNTSYGYLKDHNEDQLSDSIIQKVTYQPDIWIQITVPNEFQKVGKYNIGVTAGIETTVCAPQWIEGCNRMDLVLTSSHHSKKIFQTTKIDRQGNGGGPNTTLELTSKVEVLFEGLDITKYFKTNSNFDLDSIQESFCFLFVGHWLQGDFGQDRKNISYTIKAFLETFKNKKDAPALILKTSMGTSSHMNTEQVLDKINNVRLTVKGSLPNIYLIDGEMNDSEMNELYNHPKVKAMISLTKGEGFGRPLLEFSAVGKPIIASNWSGHVDFLYSEFNKLVGGTLTPVDKSAVVKDVILAESSWFTPDDGEVGKALKDVHKEYKKYQELAKRQAFRTNKEFTLEQMTNLLGVILNTNVPEFPKQVELTLPELKLPKLK
jgi:glycosyltransferase involved in cell wall biosynthesis